MNHAEWNVVECSDEESYFEADKHYRTTAEGGRIWEPSGEDIVHLYEEIHSKGFNQLDWQCPGKLSPSQLEHLEEEPLDNNCSGLVGQTQAKSEFDFDNDFEDNTFRATATRVPKRSQVNAPYKSQTKLSKVVQDLKKYHIENIKIKPSVSNSDISSTHSSHSEGNDLASDSNLNKSITTNNNIQQTTT